MVITSDFVKQINETH